MWGDWLIVCAVLFGSGFGAANDDRVKWQVNYAEVLFQEDVQASLVVESQETQMVTQCAARCLSKPECQVFVYEDMTRTCKLSNTPIHELKPSDKVAKGNTTIFPRSAFHINLNSVDACTGVKCQNQGICELKDSAVEGFLCYCKNGFTGRYCEVPDEQPQWAAWSGWSACSSSCGIGYRYASRTCRFKSNNTAVDRNRCDGEDARVEECNLVDCPRWTTWSKWAPCSSHFTCGEGVKLRKRSCSGGKPNVDQGCVGIDMEKKPCNAPSCQLNQAPVRLVGAPTAVGIGVVEIYDNERQLWGQVCSDNFGETAGKIVCKNLGFQGLFEVRSKASTTAPSSPFILKNLRCTSPHQTIQECSHDGWNDTVKCSRGAEIACIVNGGWSEWSDWSDCSVSCGAGEIVRRRACDHPKPSNGQPCNGETSQRKACSMDPCPVNGYWLPWSKWSSCNVTCGGGIVYRNRKCVPPRFDGKACEGAAYATKVCNDFHCPVDGYFTKWTPWTTCNVTCGGGLQERSRVCVPPKYDGKPCDGKLVDIRACNTEPCPVNGYWLPWTSWSMCNVSCGGGSQYRVRKCNDPKFGGKPCSGISKTVQPCNNQHCPIDGVWKEWSDWTECSKTCGNGTKSRTRVCEGPLYGGKFCAGPTNETELCNTFECPVDGVWLEWTSWTPCSKSCGKGVSSRNRTCVGPFYGGKDCEGVRFNEKDCNPEPCPIDGVWRDWTPWSSCSKTCSAGKETRKRTCIPPKYGGNVCDGKSKEEQTCNLGECPLPGQWSEWGAWSACSVTCRQGTRKRFRDCEKVVVTAPLKGCNGTKEEIDICNDFPCEPYLQSCSAWKEAGMIGDVVADIDPTNNRIPIRVLCNLTGSPEGETIVDNSLNKDTQVGDFENPGMNVLTPKYANTDNFRSVVALVEKSAQCRQFLKIRCRGSSIHTMLNFKTTDMMSWWENRYGEKMKYWGGSNPVAGNCGCSLHNNCAWKNLTCNCDANDEVWRTDEGYLTYKHDLPVKRLRIGDTGGSDEDAIVKLGPLICKG